jgi:hypothetical protein
MKGKLFSLVVSGLLIGLLCSSNVFAEELTTDATQSVRYQTHVQNEGWQEWKFDGDMSGTSGKSYRLEGIRIETGIPNLGIEYQTHIQNIGWESEAGRGWKSNGVMSGTEGLSYRLEAIEIRLTGSEAANYDVYYQVHAQNIGWMDWAKNGERSGTAGYGYRLEGIRIQILPKGSAAPGNRETPFRQSGFYVEQTGFKTYTDPYGEINALMFCSFVNNTNLPQSVDDIFMNLTDKNGTILGSSSESFIEYAPKVLMPGQRGFAYCGTYKYNIASLDEPNQLNVVIYPKPSSAKELETVLQTSNSEVIPASIEENTSISCLVKNPSVKTTDCITIVGGIFDDNNKLIGCLYQFGSNPIIGPNQTSKASLGDWMPYHIDFTNATRAETSGWVNWFK